MLSPKQRKAGGKVSLRQGYLNPLQAAQEYRREGWDLGEERVKAAPEAQAEGWFPVGNKGLLPPQPLSHSSSALQSVSFPKLHILPTPKINLGTVWAAQGGLKAPSPGNPDLAV